MTSGTVDRVVIAGATGFVGRAVAERLAERFEVIGLGRRVVHDEVPSGERAGLFWRRCDLFSLRSIEEALAGARIALYLVHSMMPNARLTQGRFEDLDLLLADNFARAAARAGVERIVYLGGLVPGTDPAALSPHLASRIEVEKALGAHGVPVTALRAGLVVGAGGSSLGIMVRLVRRLPLMICPAWTRSRTQPIALDDAVEAIVHCCEDPATVGRVCEIGGPDVLSYRQMMATTARVLGKRRMMVPVPLVTPALSELWVSTVTGYSRALVAPLVESLRHPMVVQDRWLQQRMDRPGKSFEEALAEAVRTEGLAREPTVRSVQRVILPKGRDALWAAREYLEWLPVAMRPLIRVHQEGRTAHMYWRGIPRPLLTLEFDDARSSSDRALFLVTGGLLAGPSTGIPRLEFRTTPDGEHILAAIQDFRPRLPWWIYLTSQARVHLWVMWRFGRHLVRLRCDQTTILASNASKQPGT